MTLYEQAQETLNNAVEETCRTRDLLIPKGYLWEQHRDNAAYVIEDILQDINDEKAESREVYAVAEILLDEWNKPPHPTESILSPLQGP